MNQPHPHCVACGACLEPTGVPLLEPPLCDECKEEGVIVESKVIVVREEDLPQALRDVLRAAMRKQAAARWN